MNDFKKNYRPGNSGRPQFGNGRRPAGGSFNRPSESFRTNCSKCNDVCEVPFRPNGKKPVFCKNCFVRDDSRDSGSYDARRAAPERPRAPFKAPEDPRIGALQRELAEVHGKLDTLIQKLESAAYASILSTSAEKKAPAKKVVAKAAAKKAPTKKPVAKKKK